MVVSMAQHGETVVEVRRSAGGCKPASDPAFLQVKDKTATVDALLTSSITLLQKAPSLTQSLFKSKSSKMKREDAVAALQREQTELRTELSDIIDWATRRGAEADMSMARLFKSEMNVREAQAAKDVAEAALKRVVDSAAKDVTSRDEQISGLQKQVQDLEAEKNELQATIAKLVRSKDNTSMKLKEMTSEYQSTADVAEREIRRLQAEVKKAEEGRESAVMMANKESADTMTGRVKEQRSLQRRYDSMKTMADANKRAAEEAKRAVEEATERAEKQAEEAATQARRMAEIKAGREAATAELESVRREHAMLHSAFVAAGGVEHQLDALRALAAARTGGKGKPAAVSGTRGALRARQGFCLHARACAAANNINKLLPVPYSGDAAGLEAVVREQGLFLCTDCLQQDDGFAA